MELPIITTKGEDGEEGFVEKEYFLPVAPDVLMAQLRAMFVGLHIQASTVAKLCMLIGECYELSKKQKYEKNHFAVSNQWAESIVSRIGGRRPLKILDELGITSKVRAHRATICPKPTLRRFCHSGFAPYRLQLSGKAARESANSGHRSRRRRLNDPCWSWVQDSLERVSLRCEDQREYLARKGCERKATAFGRGERRQKWNGQYRWNCICQIPDDVRGTLMFDAHVAVTRLDISCSFGIMLPWLFADEIANLAKCGKIKPSDEARLNAECDRLKEFLSCGDFYQELAPDNARKEVKHGFQRYLNAPEPDPPARRIGERFTQLFPATGAMLRRRKKRNSNVFHELHGRQTEIIGMVILECRENKIPCIPVWDELIVPFADRATVVEWLHMALYERTGVRAKVGGIRMAEPNRNSEPCRHGEFQNARGNSDSSCPNATLSESVSRGVVLPFDGKSA